MTIYREVSREGCCVVEQVLAEVLDTPPSYMVNCDHSLHCAFGASGLSDKAMAERIASKHSKFHDEHGPESADWVASFMEDMKDD